MIAWERAEMIECLQRKHDNDDAGTQIWELIICIIVWWHASWAASGSTNECIPCIVKRCNKFSAHFVRKQHCYYTRYDSMSVSPLLRAKLWMEMHGCRHNWFLARFCLSLWRCHNKLKHVPFCFVVSCYCCCFCSTQTAYGARVTVDHDTRATFDGRFSLSSSCFQSWCFINSTCFAMITQCTSVRIEFLTEMSTFIFLYVIFQYQ